MKKYFVVLLLALSSFAYADFKKGVACYRSGDYSCALREYKAAAKQGEAPSQYNLGLMYNNGQGVRQDYAKGMKWYRKAAGQGHANAQFNLGTMYEYGQGVRQNKKTAKEWYGKACDGERQSGCDAYRDLNEKGH